MNVTGRWRAKRKRMKAEINIDALLLEANGHM